MLNYMNLVNINTPRNFDKTTKEILVTFLKLQSAYL